MSLSQKILPISCSIQRLHHAKVPKNEIDQMRRLALIVALRLDQSARYTRVISTSSIFSVGRRWCCVGGGGAARTWNSQKMPVNIPKLNVSQPAESTAAILGSLWYCPVTRLRWLFSSTTGNRGGASIYLFCLHINEVIFAPGRAFPWDLTGFKGCLKSMQGFYHVFRTHQNDSLWKTWIVEYETAAQPWLVLSAIP